MKTRSILFALAFIGSAAVSSAQPVTVTGTVITYEPGQVIVVRGPDMKEIRYTLTPTVVVPSEVAVGKRVVLTVEPGEQGAQIVRRITTTVTPEGNVQRTTEQTVTTPSGVTTTRTTTVTGEVIRYEPGQTIVIREPDRKEVEYTLTKDIMVPSTVTVGRRVTLVTAAPQTGTTRVVKKVTVTRAKSKHGRKVVTKTKTQTKD